MAFRSELRNIIRWLLRRPPGPPPAPPGTSQRREAAEQQAAKQRILNQAQILGHAERLRNSRWRAGR